MSRLISTIALLLLAATTFAQTTAITGATVHTAGPDGTLENATILIENGRIAAVGTAVNVPAGAERVDATGKIITPGLFSPVGQLGIVEVGAVAGTNDGTQRGNQFSAGFDVVEAFNPRSVVIPISRVDGVTRAGLTPRAAGPDGEGNSSHVLSGLGSVVDLGDGDDHITRHAAVVVANLGESGSNVAGGSRAAAVQILRAALTDALDYQQNKAAYDRGDWREYSISTADMEALQTVLSGAAALLFNVNRASDISVVIGLAGDFRIRAIISGGSEAWMVADDLAGADIPVILDGANNLPSNFDRLNARFDSASILVNAGVAVAFGAGTQTHNARLLTQSAGNAVANGLAWDQALLAITSVPAAIWGVSATVGSLEAGKDADIVIWADDPLELTSYPEQVYIKGDAISMESRQTLLRDRYLQSAGDKPPAFRN